MGVHTNRRHKTGRGHSSHNRKSYHPHSKRKPSGGVAPHRPKKTFKKSSSGLSAIVGLVALGAMVFYVLGTKKSVQPGQRAIDQPRTDITLEERIEQKKKELALKQKLLKQDRISEKFKKPVQQIDPTEPASLDKGVHFTEDNSMKAVFEDLKSRPYAHDLYEDPEKTMHQQMEHQRWLEQHLQDKSEREKEEFIQNFVNLAQQQGFNVQFAKNGKVLLQPIEKEEPGEEEAEEPEEINIIYE